MSSLSWEGKLLWISLDLGLTKDRIQSQSSAQRSEVDTDQTNDDFENYCSELTASRAESAQRSRVSEFDHQFWMSRMRYLCSL